MFKGEIKGVVSTKKTGLIGTVGDGKLIGNISTKGNSLVGKVSISKASHPIYKGPYEAIPSREEQRLKTSNMLMNEDVVIHAIPKEYGRITYNQDKTIMIT